MVVGGGRHLGRHYNHTVARGSEGMPPPPEHISELDALRLFLRPFLDHSSYKNIFAALVHTIPDSLGHHW